MRLVFNKVFSRSFIAAIVLTGANHTVHAEGDHKHKHKQDSHGHEAAAYEATNTEFGAYEPDMQASHTIEVNMVDELRFVPDEIRIKKGDVVQFKTKNSGSLMHEFVLGTEASLTEHAAMMIKFSGMEHDEPYMSHVAPGESGELLWKFTEAGEFSFGCLVPGHFDAGMKGTIIVE